ncbi:ATP-binding protein [Nocardia sp. XZ_19_231]|uniref:ATP-binding protein n=1 Tax=Nocardia sp. XZ_19_231 TaxID=2769252 RepID=UPI00189028D6|nr:AAA family ATPase [Nocardia sp. XZ_19_231]
MTQQPQDYERWLATNGDYLAEYVGWLRARLTESAAETSTAPAPEPDRRGRWVRGGRSSLAEEPVATSGGRNRALPTAITAADDLDIPPPLVQLARRLGLSVFERHVLLLCAAMELDTRMAALCARAHGDPQRAYPTFALALALFDDPSWEAISPEGSLRYWRLVTLDERGTEPVTMSALRLDERVVNYVKGLNHLDFRFRAVSIPIQPPADSDLAPSQVQVADHLVSAIAQAAQRPESTVLQLVGGDGESKRLVAAHAADRMGVRLYELPAELLPEQATELELLARLWQRESALSPVMLYLDASGTERDSAGLGSLRRWLSHGRGPVFCDVDDPLPDLGARSHTVDIARPSPGEQRDGWVSALAESAGGANPERLVGQFNFNLSTIRRIAEEVSDQEAVTEQSTCLWNACLGESRPSLERLAQRIEPKATWADIKLPREEEALLHEIADQVSHRGAVYDRFGFRTRMNRGFGISVLFAGDSGTGKTMAAEVIANALGLMLYRIDLSAVVNKYIGETEKNLRRLFDAADSGGAILFFDEADALFGKRSEVKDSHDRYANIEINYLLQRMEAYRGLAILATNMKSAMDSAFLRRLRFVVTFPFPAVAERKLIWEQVFPPETPCATLDYDRLSRLVLSGGSIQNIAVNAAFRAAGDGGTVTMAMILTAARTEFRKNDRPVNEADFRWLERAGGSA